MSLHSSLKTSKSERKHRTVLKRYEKFSALKEKGILKDDDSVFGMPKLKIIRVKIKKEKAEEKPEEAQVAAEGAVAPQAPVAAALAGAPGAPKGAAPKGAVPKGTAAKPVKEEKKEKK